jgi:ribosome biogenesis protein MAK21
LLCFAACFAISNTHNQFPLRNKPPQIGVRSKNTLFLNLLFRSIKGDRSEQRAAAFLKRLCICSTQATPPVAAGLLFLISEVLASRKSLRKMLSGAEQPEAASSSAGAGDDASEGGGGGSTAHILGNFDASKREPDFAVKGT